MESSGTAKTKPAVLPKPAVLSGSREPTKHTDLTRSTSGQLTSPSRVIPCQHAVQPPDQACGMADATRDHCEVLPGANGDCRSPVLCKDEMSKPTAKEEISKSVLGKEEMSKPTATQHGQHQEQISVLAPDSAAVPLATRPMRLGHAQINVTSAPWRGSRTLVKQSGCAGGLVCPHTSSGEQCQSFGACGISRPDGVSCLHQSGDNIHATGLRETGTAQNKGAALSTVKCHAVIVTETPQQKVARDVKPPLPKNKPQMIAVRRQRSDSSQLTVAHMADTVDPSLVATVDNADVVDHYALPSSGGGNKWQQNVTCSSPCGSGPAVVSASCSTPACVNLSSTTDRECLLTGDNNPSGTQPLSPAPGSVSAIVQVLAERMEPEERRITLAKVRARPSKPYCGAYQPGDLRSSSAPERLPSSRGTVPAAAHQQLLRGQLVDHVGYLEPRCSHTAPHSPTDGLTPSEYFVLDAAPAKAELIRGSEHHYSDAEEDSSLSKADRTVDLTNKTDALASLASSHLYEAVTAPSDSDSQGGSHSGDEDDVFCNVYDTVLDDAGREHTESSTDSDSEPEAEQADATDKRKRKAYLVAEEMMKTEAEFCDNLKLLNEDFRKFVTVGLDAAGAAAAIPSRLLDRILIYLPQLHDFSKVLTADVTERVRNWESNPQVADIFVKKGPFLKLYTTYIIEFERATAALDEAMKAYPAFAEKVREFESTERCRHLLLRHFMLKPIQRVPQYKLLLTDYLKYVTEGSPDHGNAVEALAIVSGVAKHSNEAMKQDDSFQALLNIQNLLVGEFKVIEPSRKLLKSGELLKHSRRDKQARTFFLFNDVLLIARPIGSLYKLKYVLPLQNMKTSRPIAAQDDNEYEFTVISKQKSFAVVANTPAEGEAWFAAINDAIRDREEKLSSFMVGAQLSCSGGVKDDMVGEVAPVWIPDDRVSMCMVCNQQFTVFFRRHHCRGCGKVVCGECSDYKAPLKYEDYQSRRVCANCHTTLRKRLLDDHEVTSATDGKLPSKDALTQLFRGQMKAGPTQRRTKPAVLAEVHAGDAGAVSGYLRVFTKKLRWKRFWFVIKGHVLYKYNASQDTAAIESTPLLGYKVSRLPEAFESVDSELLFKLSKPGSTVIEPVIFRTKTDAAAAKWFAVMEKCVEP